MYSSWHMSCGSCQQPFSINVWHVPSAVYRVIPPDDEQYACSKHVEVKYWNKWKVNSASCWFILYGFAFAFLENRLREDYTILTGINEYICVCVCVCVCVCMCVCVRACFPHDIRHMGWPINNSVFYQNHERLNSWFWWKVFQCRPDSS